MRSVALRIRAADVEPVLDALLPRLVDGVHERGSHDGFVELVAFSVTAPLPGRAELQALAGPALVAIDEAEVPDDWRERRRQAGGGVAIADRVWLRCELDPPAAAGLIDVVMERGAAFGSGEHPTTRMCIELMLEGEARGSFADLGCGAGALAILAVKLGFAPVEAVDLLSDGVRSAAANAALNGVTVRVRELDLLAEPCPPASVLAANVPPEVHAAIAAGLPDGTRTVIASGFAPSRRAAVVASYARHDLREVAAREARDWVAVRLERDGG